MARPDEDQRHTPAAEPAVRQDAPERRPVSRHRIVIVGGGNGGVSAAARLRRAGVTDIALIEPQSTHRYQPLFSHVAGGTARASETTRPQAAVMPAGVSWIRDAVAAVDPRARTVTLGGGDVVGYEHLVLSPGIVKDWDAVPGLGESLQTPHVASHYVYDGAQKLSALLRDTRSGTVVFTQPPGPASCAGASQKPMYQACAHWRARGVLDDIRVVLVVPEETVFGLPHIDAELDRIVAEYGIELRTASELRRVDGVSREVVIGPRTGGGAEERIGYDVLNVVPPQSAPDWIAASGLAAADDPGGFAEVDPGTLRHRRFDDIWAIGDAAATTNSKSGGALRKQTYVLAKNLTAAISGRTPAHRYDGYGVCPMTVSRSSVVWAEFGPDGRPDPTIPFLPGMFRENRLSWIADRHVLPWVYWNLILPGRV